MKAPIKREMSNACFASSEREVARPKVKMPMLVLLAGMVRTNPAIRGSKRQVSDRCTPIVALLPVTLQSHRTKMYPSFGSVLKTAARMNAVQLSVPFIV